MKYLMLMTATLLLLGCGGNETADQTQAPAEQSATENAAPAGNQGAQATGIDKSDPDWKLKVTAPQPRMFGSNETYTWVLETNHGTMEFRLFHEEAPMHVSSTIHLTELGFYDDTIFHRVIPGFMAQGGDPTGTGRGGPAYRYAGEFAAGLSHNKPGLLSMANAGPNTDGSQFFITFVPTPFLDGKHTIFGELTTGMEVLKAFEARGSRSGQTSELLAINKATIVTTSAP